MEKQLTASEVRAEAHRHANEVENMLNAFADLLEAREKAVPVGYISADDIRELDANREDDAECAEAIEMLIASRPFASNHTAIYTHPAPSDAERLESPSNLQEALCVIENAALHGVTLHGDDIPRLRATVDRIAPAQQSQDAERLPEALDGFINTGNPRWDKAAFQSRKEGNRPGSGAWMQRIRELLATQAQPPAGQFDPGRDEVIRIHPDVAKAQAIPFDVNDGRATRSAQAQPPAQSKYAPTYPDQAKDPFWTVPGMVDTRPKTHGTQARPAARVTDAMVEDGCVAWNKSAGLGYAVADRDCMRAAIEAALAAQENPNGL